jgi:hypothetical protein
MAADIIDLAGKKRSSQQPPGSEGGTPPISVFEFQMNDGDVFQEEGYLLSGAWVAVGQGDGSVTALVPLEQLRVVRRAIEDELVDEE